MPLRCLHRFNQECPDSVVELRHLVRAFCRMEGICPGREQLDRSIKLLLLRTANKQLEVE